MVCFLPLVGCSADVDEGVYRKPTRVLFDAGPVDAGIPDAEVPAECAEPCDCFDDNACTTDACIDRVCVNDPVDGGCGSTVGTCRGPSCCTGAWTCFIAYDNDSACVVVNDTPFMCLSYADCHVPVPLEPCHFPVCIGGFCGVEISTNDSICFGIGNLPGTCLDGACILKSQVCSGGTTCGSSSQCSIPPGTPSGCFVPVCVNGCCSVSPC